LILGIGDDFAWDMSCDLNRTFLSESIKLSWFLNLRVVLVPIPFKTSMSLKLLFFMLSFLLN
jgi:hypothetical protein